MRARGAMRAALRRRPSRARSVLSTHAAADLDMSHHRRSEGATARVEAAIASGDLCVVELPPHLAEAPLTPPGGLTWHDDPELFSRWAAPAVARLLPEELTQVLGEMRGGGGPCALLIRGCGVVNDGSVLEATTEPQAAAASLHAWKEAGRESCAPLLLPHRPPPITHFSTTTSRPRSRLAGRAIRRTSLPRTIRAPRRSCSGSAACSAWSCQPRRTTPPRRR